MNFQVSWICPDLVKCARGVREHTGGGSSARGVGNGLDGGRGVNSASIHSEVGVVSEKRSVFEVDLDKATSSGPLGGVEDARVHAHGLLVQVRVSMRFVILEHPYQHVVHVHAASIPPHLPITLSS